MHESRFLTYIVAAHLSKIGAKQNNWTGLVFLVRRSSSDPDYSSPDEHGNRRIDLCIQSVALLLASCNAAEREFEVIRTCGDFVCAVVPARRFGWIEMVQVVKLEPNSPVTPSGGINELGLQFTCIEEESPQVFRSFLASIGSMISAVDLSHNSLADEFKSLQSIITPCTHLQHLVLNDVDLATSEWELLMNTLHRGDLGCRLISLNLNDNRLDATKITDSRGSLRRREDTSP